MPHPEDGTASRPRRGAAVLRGVGFTLAVALGAVAVWLIVTSQSQKRLELGVLAGLWGLLLGAFAVFGTRRAPRQELAVPAPQPGQELLLRADADVERAAESAARRHFEARLEQMLRQEIQTTLGHEIASLREEVASLRNDLLEKVGGQLRLERIETTRVIGSDIEALQREIDQLKHGRPVLDASSVYTQPAYERPAYERPAYDAAVTRTIPRVVDPEPPQAPPPAPERPSGPQRAEPRPVEPRRPEPVADLLSALPRLRPFTDFELDPVVPAESAAGPAAPVEGRTTDAEPAEEGPSRPGPAAERRHDSARAAGRHGRPDETDRSYSGGGRRRRAPDDQDNVLARILARESTE